MPDRLLHRASIAHADEHPGRAIVVGGMSPEASVSGLLWPYLPTLEMLGLALALGLFVGLERERRGKEAGVRTFALIAVLGCIGAMLGDPFALAALGLVALLSSFLNLETLRAGEGTELTTTAAMCVTAFIGILCGHGHTITPAALGVVTTALLAWKQPMAGFSKALTETELRSAIVLAILAFVIYPALPPGALDRWGLIEPKAAWMTVLLVAGMGFANYVLLKIYGERGVEVTGFLGGLVNSTVTVTALAERDRQTTGALADATFRGVVLATAAMVLRNAVLLALLAPLACVDAAIPFALMAAVVAVLLVWRRRKRATSEAPAAPALPLESPFSVTSALRFGLIFLALQVAGTLAERALGQAGFYAVSIVGGFVSSASSVASAGALAAHGQLSPLVAGSGGVLASIASALVNLPLTARVSRDRPLTRRLAVPLIAIAAVGAIAIAGQQLVGWELDLAQLWR